MKSQLFALLILFALCAEGLASKPEGMVCDGNRCYFPSQAAAGVRYERFSYSSSSSRGILASIANGIRQRREQRQQGRQSGGLFWRVGR